MDVGWLVVLSALFPFLGACLWIMVFDIGWDNYMIFYQLK